MKVSKGKLSKSKKKGIVTIVGSVSVVTAGLVAAFLVGWNQMDAKYRLEIETLKQTIDTNQRTVYTASGDGIAAGTAITEENVTMSTIFSSIPSEYYLTSDDFGKIATVDIAPNQPVYMNAVGEDLIFSLREQEFSLLNLSTNLEENDFVDVRIMFPNGENYIVLAKKCIMNLNLSQNNCFFWLDEQEISLISSAIVDTYLHEGAILYTTKYIDDGQEQTEATYTPTGDCMIAMQNNPNILELATNSLNASARTAMDARLQAYESTNNVDLSTSVSKYENSQDDEQDETATDPSVLTGVDTGEDLVYNVGEED